MEELLARLRALIRRSAGHASSDIACGPLKIDTKSNKVFGWYEVKTYFT